jgi:hypothetical protein
LITCRSVILFFLFFVVFYMAAIKTLSIKTNARLVPTGFCQVMVYFRFRYNKTVIAFIWNEHQVVNPQEVVFPWATALGENNHPWVDNFKCSPHMKAITDRCYCKKYSMSYLWNFVSFFVCYTRLVFIHWNLSNPNLLWDQHLYSRS